MSKAATHKAALVRAAMRLFRRQGYASSGMQQILAESGAPKGSLYYYFPNGKEALAEAAVDEAAGLIAAMLDELIASHPDPTEFVSAYCRTMANWMEESDFRSGCPIATVMLETVPASAMLAAAGERAIDAWIARIEAVFVPHSRDRASARSRAQALVAAIEGALILARIRRSTRPFDDVARSFAHPLGQAPLAG